VLKLPERFMATATGKNKMDLLGHVSFKCGDDSGDCLSLE